jgi:hypothetical protein
MNMGVFKMFEKTVFSLVLMYVQTAVPMESTIQFQVVVHPSLMRSYVLVIKMIPY